MDDVPQDVLGIDIGDGHSLRTAGQARNFLNLPELLAQRYREEVDLSLNENPDCCEDATTIAG